jgi:hypothetical protein
MMLRSQIASCRTFEQSCRGGLPHRKHPATSHLLVSTLGMFSARGRAGRFDPALAPAPGDTVASEHETSCGFTGTDLAERLGERGIKDVVLAGALSNTCVEATGRTPSDLGYRVTFLSDAVTAQTWLREAWQWMASARRRSSRQLCSPCALFSPNWRARKGQTCRLLHDRGDWIRTSDRPAPSPRDRLLLS